MLKIRLARHGAKKNPFYRIVVIEDSRGRSGKALEVIGYWYPKKDSLKISQEKLSKWIKNGARKTQAVNKLIST